MSRVLHRFLLYTKGNPVRCILFSIMVFIFTIGLSFITMFRTASIKYQEIVEMHYPAQVSILNSAFDEYDIKSVPQDFIDNAKRVNTVFGSNFTRKIKVKPLDFENHVMKEDNSFASVTLSDLVEIEIATDIKMCDLFLSEQAVLEVGNIPDASNQGVLIEKTLAQKNNIRCDDTIQFQYSEKSDSYIIKATVIGIYELDHPIQISNGNGYIDSPYSRIFINYDLAKEYSDFAPKVDGYQFFVRHYNQVEETVNEINALNPDYETFTVMPSTYIGYIQLMKSMQNISRIIKLFSITFVFFMSIIFLLMLLMFFRNYYKEMIILMSLGETNWAIRFQYLIQQSILVVLPSAFAALISLLFS